MRKNISLFFVALILLTMCTIHASNEGGQVNEAQLQRLLSKGGDPAQSSGKRITLSILFGSGVEWLNPKVEGMKRAGSVAGLKYGIAIDVNFTHQNNYYFSTGLFINHSGGKLSMMTQVTDDLCTQVEARKFNAVYATIPTGIKLKTPELKNFAIVANFGLTHSFRLSANYADTYADPKSGTMIETDKRSCTETTALFRESAYIGAGLEYVIKGDFRVFFYATYTHGYLNFFTKESHNLVNGEADNATMSSVELQLGITF